jgi:hypothetical protein
MPPPSTTLHATSPIPVPHIDSEVPVAIIPTASVAPLDGEPDGERINTFTIAAADDSRGMEPSMGDVLGDLRSRVLSRPLTWLAAAFALGVVMGRPRR